MRFQIEVERGLNQGSANGGFQTVVRVFGGNKIPQPPFYLNLTSLLPQFYLCLTSFLPFFNLNLTSASSRISNHGLETTVYRLLVKLRCKEVISFPHKTRTTIRKPPLTDPWGPLGDFPVILLGNSRKDPRTASAFSSF